MNHLSNKTIWESVEELLDREEIEPREANLTRLMGELAKDVSDDLMLELDRAIWAHSAAYLEAAFVAGWRCARQPESLVFAEGEDR